jgi:hypothetical protein
MHLSRQRNKGASSNNSAALYFTATRKQAAKIVFLMDSREGQEAHRTGREIADWRADLTELRRAGKNWSAARYCVWNCCGVRELLAGRWRAGGNPGTHIVEGKGRDANLAAAFADEGDIVIGDVRVAANFG